MGASDDKLLFALGLKRQRLKSGSTVREVSRRLNSKSPNAFQGYTEITLTPDCDLICGQASPNKGTGEPPIQFSQKIMSCVGSNRSNNTSRCFMQRSIT